MLNSALLLRSSDVEGTCEAKDRWSTLIAESCLPKHVVHQPNMHIVLSSCNGFSYTWRLPWLKACQHVKVTDNCQQMKPANASVWFMTAVNVKQHKLLCVLDLISRSAYTYR